jgi:hypothetical protein
MHVDAHLYAALLAGNSAFALCEVLPDTDIVNEMSFILDTQLKLFAHLIEGKHFGTEALQEFIVVCDEAKVQANRLKERLI